MLRQYTSTIKQLPRPRARDFFDIYRIVLALKLESQLLQPTNIKILKSIFKAKQVPIDLLSDITTQKEFHADNFISVKDTQALLRVVQIEPEAVLKALTL